MVGHNNGNFTPDACNGIWERVTLQNSNTNIDNALQPLGNSNQNRRRPRRAQGGANEPAGKVVCKIAEAAGRANVQIRMQDLEVLFNMLTHLLVGAGCYEFHLTDQVFDSLIAWWDVLEDE